MDGNLVNLNLYKERYIGLVNRFREACLGKEPKKVALSFTVAFFIGIVPFIGVTFITVTLVGAWLKLNQIIVQTVHLLVSPLQIILIPVFLKAGQVLFHPAGISAVSISSRLVHADVLTTLRQFGITLFYGLAVWVVFSIVSGLVMYRILVVVFRIRSKSGARISFSAIQPAGNG